MEVALETRCTFTVFNRHRSGQQVTMRETVDRLVKGVQRRREIGRPSGVVLISGQFLAQLPEMAVLKAEILEICGDAALDDSVGRRTSTMPLALEEVEGQLRDEGAKTLFAHLPRAAQMSLIRERDSSGMPALPEVEVERILGRFVQKEVEEDSRGAASPQHTFAPRFHAVELMCNAPLPSNFDCAFGYTLGHTAAALLCERRTFHLASCIDMHLPVAEWKPCALPFTAIFGGGDGDVSCRTLQRLQRRNIPLAYEFFKDRWVERNAVKAPGPVQFGDDGDVGPMSDRPYALLAEYLSLDELKQLIHPDFALPPPPELVISPDHPRVVRDMRLHRNLSALEQARVGYQPALPSYLRGGVLAQNEDITPQACTNWQDLDATFPLTKAGKTAVRLLPFHQAPAEKASASAPRAHSGADVPESGPRVPRLRADSVLGGVDSLVLSSPRQKRERPARVGVVFSSSQAPGFHTVVAGLYDYFAGLDPPSELIGFLGGYAGLIEGHSIPISKDMVDAYRNLGGQDMLCQFGEPASVHTKDHLLAVTETVAQLQLTGLVLVGTLTSHLDSTLIDEALAAKHLGTRVVGVPASLDNDFPFVQQAVGYDTTARTLSGFLGDVGKLTEHTGDQWIFVRIVGDAAAHLAVECTLQAHPNLVMLSGGNSLGEHLESIVKYICDLIVSRHKEGKNHGVLLLPSGFVLDILEMRQLFREIMEIMEGDSYETGWSAISYIAAKLKPSSAALFEVFPRDVQYEICFGSRERDSRMMPNLKRISFDRLLLRFVQIELGRRRRLGHFVEDFFRGSCYPMLHQARSAMPTNFDCDLAYTLGWGAAMLVDLGKGGQLVHASHLEEDVEQWRVGGIPLTSLLRVEIDEETGETSPSPSPIQLLKQRGVTRPFAGIRAPRDRVAIYLGPVQFSGSVAASADSRRTWAMVNFPLQDPVEKLREIAGLCSELQSTMALAKAESTLYAVNSLLTNAVSVLDSYKTLSEANSRQKQSLADIPMETRSQKKGKDKSAQVTSTLSLDPHRGGRSPVMKALRGPVQPPGGAARSGATERTRLPPAGCAGGRRAWGSPTASAPARSAPWTPRGPPAGSAGGPRRAARPAPSL
ncbi:unnamed protein product [Prorocentrum cordatum]|uniref:Phosphofructokinase domain-containing protein n=1 Tax=Prorocentrum cordatum TaxID=2364126 RepID=A0ABN9XVX9_9DINO|nr:unnamed protein product [Polarella glacialis]